MVEHASRQPRPTAAEAQFNAMSPAVNIEAGRQTYAIALDEIESIRKQRGDLPIGPLTEQAFDELLTSVAAGQEGLMIYGGKSGFYVPLENKIILGTGIVEWERKNLGGSLVASGIELDNTDLAELAIRYVTRHEVGHVLQSAYRIASYKSRWETEHQLSAKALQLGVVNKHPDLPEPDGTDGLHEVSLQFQAACVDQERFAEGFAQMITVDELTEQLALDKQASGKLSDSLHTMLAHQVPPIAAIIQAHDGNFIKIFEEIRAGENLNLMQLGYGSPHTRQDVIKEMRLTP